MIKLDRAERPAYLSDDKVDELTNLFKSDKKHTVWKHKDIHSALLISSNDKCAFCESALQISSAYMEIEHFKPKDDFPDNVVEWGNLLPSCKRCNTKKGTHNVVNEPIINPFDIDPKKHLTQEGCRIYFKDHLGKTTREVLDLNDKRLVQPRFEIWNYIRSKLEEIWEDLESKNKLTKRDTNKLRGLLVSCQADKPFSSFASASFLGCPDHLAVVEKLKSSSLWDDDIDDLYQKLAALALDKR
ncbi:HNH endonuclease [Acinetobacter pollinis]|uniref:HNH endonuclease n=1 Tax=Acinetobacter pollinis TaxID=2605270 RepID=A0ABU6DSW6_9GAMM|nr:HNH endonuclease [Acinetobacter pollinis]MEB5475998.1 HNH endonuclease [Acinetobacter pollinis]